MHRGPFKDLSGKQFGDLFVVKEVGTNNSGNILWECSCSCGNKTTKTSNSLTSGNVKYCSRKCPSKGRACNAVDLVGKKFGKLTVERFYGIRLSKSGYKIARWECNCSCGGKNIADTGALRDGNVRSCGCLIKEVTRAREYTGNGHICGSILNMLQNKAKAREIEVKITLDDIWNQYTKQNGLCYFSGVKVNFPNCSKDYQNYSSWNASIDRLDSNSDYTPDNIVIVTKQVNLMKRSMTEQEFLNLIEQIYNFRLKE